MMMMLDRIMNLLLQLCKEIFFSEVYMCESVVLNLPRPWEQFKTNTKPYNQITLEVIIL